MLVAGFNDWFSLGSARLGYGALAAAYILVLTGVLLHLGVEGVKQSQSRPGRPLVIGHALDWLHLHWAGISLSVVPIVVVTIGLRLAETKTGTEEAALFLFAGSSVDSVAGMILTRFDSLAAKGLQAVGLAAQR